MQGVGVSSTNLTACFDSSSASLIGKSGVQISPSPLMSRCPNCDTEGDLENYLAPGQLRCPTDLSACRVKTFMTEDASRRKDSDDKGGY